MTKIFFSLAGKFVLMASVFSLTVNCSHPASQPSAGAKNPSGYRTLAAEAMNDWIEALPGQSNEFLTEATKRVREAKAYGTATPAQRERMARRLAKYVGFVVEGSIPTEPDNPETAVDEGAKSRSKLIQKIFSRLMSSSLQFIDCADINDFECLEKLPLLQPRSAMRVEENPEVKLGEPKPIDLKFDNSIEWFFTTQIFVPESEVDLSATLASKLENKIRTEGVTSIHMALYGIDDITKSMGGVYTALAEKIKSGIEVKAVFDQEGIVPEATEPLVMSYIPPTNADEANRWILKPTTDPKTNMAFQYNGGTQGLIHLLAKEARSSKRESDAKGRIEWKDDGIMHNKYFVFDNKGQKSVWTGTANVARTCMGSERNSNMGLFIRSNEIAQTFLDEFFEMYDFPSQTPESPHPEKVLGPGSSTKFPYGKFHNAKRPNTHRYFRFTDKTPTEADDTDFKIYFSPTDDGEHRAILPMLHSAKSGDVLRISMFGAAGIEYVRAIQLAASRGVKVEIILDSPTGFTPGSWAAAKADASLRQPNPFGSGDITMKKNSRGDGSTWKQNHQKIGLLLRKSSSGLKAEQLVIGSQNWSASGNDQNDENLIVMRRLIGLAPGEAFDTHFRTFLWPNAVPL